jgi:hypothetical protein
MNDKDTDKKFIAPNEYKEILKGIDLKNIILNACSCELEREKISPETKVDIRETAVIRKQEKDNLEILHKYIFEAKSQSKKEIFLTIKCEYILEYEAAKEITNEFFDIFKRTSLPLNSWPFFREFVNNITSRMYIPPFTLPLLKR